MAPKPRIPSAWGHITRCTQRGVVRYRLRGQVDGQPVDAGVYDTIEDAQDVARELARQYAPRSTVLTVWTWVTEACDARDRGHHRDAVETRRILTKHLRGHRIANVALRQLRPEQVREWIFDVSRRKAEHGKHAGKPLAANTVRNTLRALSTVLSDAVDAGKLTRNPALGVRPPKAPLDRETWAYLTAPEIGALLAHPRVMRRPRLRAILTVAIYTGLRAGEMWGLRWEDVRLGDAPELVVCRSYGGATKGGRARRVPLLPPAEAALRRWQEDQVRARKRSARRAAREGRAIPLPSPVELALVFPARSGLARRGYDAQWSRWREALGVRADVRFHDLRHTCASHLVMGSWGRPWRLEEVQVWLGHQSITTTQRYARLAPEAMVGAAKNARERWVDVAADVATEPPTPIRRPKT